MNDQIQSIVKKVKTGLQTIYGTRLQSVLIFGSYVREEADVESDLDVLIVLDDFRQYGAEVDRTCVFFSSLSIESGLTIGSIFVREKDWEKQDSPFIRNVRKEAVPA